ncbi:unnamed protein product [Protopolystoma xenopodis]|uniref:Uncharacterized protein n=1 Tax=Protopolystoma xenopodis TaxID=117903 RepID=A0A448WAQ0_9PLAT|nr:unnamed protein product [Protopolystoma xenopodis]
MSGSVHARLKVSGFFVPPNAVSILSGLNEGLFAWLTINFLTHRLLKVPAATSSSYASPINSVYPILRTSPVHQYQPHSYPSYLNDESGNPAEEHSRAAPAAKSKTFLTFDLGGRSLQVTFMPVRKETLENAPNGFMTTTTAPEDKLTLGKGDNFNHSVSINHFRNYCQSFTPDSFLPFRL